MNLVIIVISAILALASAMNGTTPPPGVPGVAAYATPTPAPANPPARYDVVGAGGPT